MLWKRREPPVGQGLLFSLITSKATLLHDTHSQETNSLLLLTSSISPLPLLPNFLKPSLSPLLMKASLVIQPLKAAVHQAWTKQVPCNPSHILLVTEPSSPFNRCWIPWIGPWEDKVWLEAIGLFGIGEKIESDFGREGKGNEGREWRIPWGKIKMQMIRRIGWRIRKSKSWREWEVEESGLPTAFSLALEVVEEEVEDMEFTTDWDFFLAIFGARLIDSWIGRKRQRWWVRYHQSWCFASPPSLFESLASLFFDPFKNHAESSN